MREIIHLQAGQCGNQIGSKVCVCVCECVHLFVGVNYSVLLLLLGKRAILPNLLLEFYFTVVCLIYRFNFLRIWRVCDKRVENKFRRSRIEAKNTHSKNIVALPYGMCTGLASDILSIYFFFPSSSSLACIKLYVSFDSNT